MTVSNKKLKRKIPTVPAKPLNGTILVKETEEKESSDKDKKSKGADDTLFVEVKTEVVDVGTNTELGLKPGDIINTRDYGNEVVTAKVETETHITWYILIEPSQIVGVYQ